MANYVKATNFTAKDSLLSGDSGKIIKGAEIDTEFTAIASAVASKANTNSPAFTGTPTGPTATAGTNTTQLATTAFVTAALSAAYPVGSIYINAGSASNPSVLLGFGTWTAFGAGKVLVGFDAGDTLFDTLEETGGSKSASIPAHTHTATTVATDSGHVHGSNAVGFNAPTINWVGTGGLQYRNSNSLNDTTVASANITATTTVDSTGVDGATANLPPYITVNMWKRTA
jgi:hypothetical protein